MAQNTKSITANRGSVPGTANDTPVAPPLFTQPAKREYVADARRVGDGLQAPELTAARAHFVEGNFSLARAEARRVLKAKESSAAAKMEAGDLIDRTDIDQGPIATAVAFVILLGLMLMFIATSGK